ncbi:MAG: hypothetical protein JW726_09845 [Anaerolineales bacterium]|nr:hypothetical protein [Anaerolineales bacterium]
MGNQRGTIQLSLLIVLSIAALVGLGWTGYRMAAQGLGGKEFIIQYTAIRGLIMNGDDPYGEKAARRVLEAVERVTWDTTAAPARYNSPLYSGLLVLPFAFFSNELLAQGGWLAAQGAGMAAILLLLLHITRWRPKWWIFTLVSLLNLASVHSLASLASGGLFIWAALFCLLALLAIRNGRYELAGISLALSFIEPQVTLVFVILMIVRAISARKWAVPIWFLSVLLVVSIIGVFIVPEWPLGYLRRLWRFGENFPGTTPGMMFKSWWPAIGAALGWALSGILMLAILFEWWLALRREFRWFLWACSLVLAVSPWLGIQTRPETMVTLWVPLILLLAVLQERWPRAGGWVGVVSLVLLWGWEVALLSQSLSDPRSTAAQSLIFPLPLLLLVGLYWIRWWAIRPPRLLVEELRAIEEH